VTVNPPSLAGSSRPKTAVQKRLPTAASSSSAVFRALSVAVRTCRSITRRLDLRFGDAEVCGESGEIVEGGQLCLGGVDGVSDVVEEPAGLTDRPVEGHGCHGEERGDDDQGELEPLLEHGGQEPVDEGEAGAPAGVEASGRGLLPVAAASLVEVCFPLSRAGRCQPGDQRVPLLVRDAGEGGMGQPVAAGAGFGPGRDRKDAVPAVFLGAEGVVPVAVPVMAAQWLGVQLPVTDAAPVS
jgi:hypothetical protein